MNSFLELCRERRSYRKYTDADVSKEQLDRILQCALMSPSGKRLNPWEFYVCRDRDVIRGLSDCRSMGTTMLQTAPVAIAVALDAEKTDTWQADGAIAALNLQLASTDEGLGSCWCHILDRDNAEERVREALDIPEKLRVLCLITIGHKGEERKMYDLEKLPYEKLKVKS